MLELGKKRTKLRMNKISIFTHVFDDSYIGISVDELENNLDDLNGGISKRKANNISQIREPIFRLFLYTITVTAFAICSILKSLSILLKAFFLFFYLINFSTTCAIYLVTIFLIIFFKFIIFKSKFVIFS